MSELDDTEKLLFGVGTRGSATTPLETASLPTQDFLRMFEDKPPPQEDFAIAPTPVYNPAFVRGLGAGIEQIGTDFRAAGAVGLSLFGFDKDAAELIQIVHEREAATARRYPRRIRSVEDIETIGDFTSWAGRTLGEQVPVLASILIGGGGGAILGRLVGKGALSLGASQALAMRFPSIGAGIGAFGVTTGLETGATGAELHGATGELHPELSLAAGVVKGAFELAVPAFIGSRFGLTPDITGGILRRIIARFDRVLPSRAATALGVGFGEAVTEALQETVDVVAREFVDENFELLSAETRSRILNAAASGGLVGAVLGGAAGRGRVRTREEEPPPNAPVDLGTQSTDPTLPVSELEPGELPYMQPLGPEGSVELEQLELPFTAQLDASVARTIEERFAGFPQEHRRESQISETVGPYPHGATADQMDAALQEFTVEPDILDGKTAKSYDVDAHTPGTAVWLVDRNIPLRNADRVRMSAIVDFYNKMMKVYGFTEDKLVVHLDSLNSTVLPGYFTNRGVAGNFGGSRGGVGKKIGLRSVAASEARAQTLVEPELKTATQASARFFETAAHEFGHYLVHKRFATSDAGIQQKVLSAYHRDLARVVEGGTTANYIDLFSAGVRSNFWERGRDQDLTDLVGGPSRLDYFLSFDEWIADQVARHFGTKLETYGPVEGFFKRVAAELKDYFSRVAKTFRLQAPPEVEDWLASIRNNPAPHSASALAEGNQRGQEENARHLNPFNNGEYIPAPQASTDAPARLLNKLGISKQKVGEIRALTDKFNWFMDLMYNLQQISQRNPHLKALSRYVERVDQWYNFQMRWISRANDRVHAWMHIGNRQQQALSAFIYEIDSMAYLSPAEVEDGVVRQPTERELEAFAKKHKLEAVSYELFLEIRDDFSAVLDQIEETSIRDVRRTISDPALQTLRIAAINDDMDRLRKRPYFPHARFGDTALVVKDEKGTTLYMEQFANARQARSAIPDVKREFPDAAIRIDKIPEEVRIFRGLPESLLTNIRTKLKLSDTQARWLDDLIVEMSPSASFRRRMQRRANVPGFSMNAMRAYASYFFSGAKHLARIEYRPLMEEEVQNFSKEISGEAALGEAVDVQKRRRIQDYMSNHLEHIMNPKPDWAQLRSVAFQWYLGFNPSSAALNFTQPVLVGWPYLAARFNDVKAMNAMMGAVKNIQSMYKYESHLGKGKMSMGLFKAIDRAVKEGVVDESQATELASTAQGSYIQQLLPGTASQRRLMQFARWSSWLFQQSERMNRRVMFRAAWDLAIKNPDTKYLFELEEQHELEMRELYQSGFTLPQARAYLAARDAVRRTQFQYAPHARPKFMRGKKSVLFAFFMFQQSMIHFTLHSPGHIRFLAMMLFMAGLMGLPGAEDLSELAKFAARNLLGKEFDLEKEVRELVTDLTDDPEVADLLLFGTGRVGFGLPALMDMVGLPKAEFDFSRRIGMGRVIPGVAELGPPGLDFDERLSRITTDTAGAAYGMGINIVRALQDDALPIDDFKRWERAMPTAARNISRAVRFLREERERTRTGATLIDFDLTDADHIAETALVALGFQPTRLTRGWDEALMRKEVEAYWQARRAIILRNFDYSFITQDGAARKQAWQDIRQYNSTVPFGVMRLTTKDLRRSRKQRIKARIMFERGLSRSRYLRPVTNEIDRLFPREDKPQAGDVTIEDAPRR